jgi:hypothetical protein
MRCVTITACVFLLFMACSTGRKVQYELPAAMLPHVKEHYRAQCETGCRLYAANCGSCHNIKDGRKEIIPDFKEEELRGYALRVANARHEEKMADSLVTEEELGIIMTFLRYKKPSGATHSPATVKP